MGAAASTRGPEPTFSVAELRQQLDSLPDDGKGNVTARQLLSLFPTLDPSAIETIVGSAVGATTLPTTSYKHSVPTTAPHKHKGMARGTSSRHTTQAIKSAVQAGDWEKVATHLGEVFTEFDTDANGVLFWDEFESLMLSLELNWVDGDNGWEEIKQLWAKFDVNNDQRVQWHEYLTPLSVSREPPRAVRWASPQPFVLPTAVKLPRLPPTHRPTDPPTHRPAHGHAATAR